MERSKKKAQVYKSMKDFEEKKFPKSFRRQLLEVSTDARTIGINLAKESLEMVRNRLSE